MIIESRHLVEILDYASRLTEDGTDEDKVEANAQVLVDWVTAGEGDSGAGEDVRLRMKAFDRVYWNLKHSNELPMDDMPGMTARAAKFYVFLGGDPKKVSLAAVEAV